MGKRIKKKVSVYLDPDVHANLEEFCQKLKMQKSELIEKLIKNGLFKPEKVEPDSMTNFFERLDYEKSHHMIKKINHAVETACENVRSDLDKRQELQLSCKPSDTLEIIAKEIREKMMELYEVKLSKSLSIKYARQVKTHYQRVNVTLSTE